ncbi:hypothetical protein N9Z02_01105 [Akkermansiaceae bacterium]|nr:hypothetical protein [Akkermansiaceae bacterium]
MDIIDLRNGDDVKVGDVQFEYSLADDELDVLDDEDFKPKEKKKAAAEPAKAPPKRKVQAPPAAASPGLSHQPMLASNSGGGDGMLTFGTIVLGIAALLGGLNNGYASSQKKDLGRTGEIFLHKDILDGRPAIEKPAEE